MFNLIPNKKSLFFKVAAIVFAAGLLELMLFLTWENGVSTLKGNAAAMNMVGSERMRLLKIALLAEHYAEGAEQDSGAKVRAKVMLNNEMDVFENILFGLRDGNPRYNLKKEDEPEIIAMLNQNIDKWNKTVKPMFQNILFAPTDKTFAKALENYRQEVFAYVNSINELVALFERHSEEKVDRLRKLQFVFLFLSGLIAAGSLIFVYTVIIKPIRRLNRAVTALAAGDLSQTVPVLSKDEIGELGGSFNEMRVQLKAHIDSMDNMTVQLRSHIDALDEKIIETKESRKKYELLINSVEGVVWEADPATFQFIFVSAQAERLLGYPVEQWLNKPTFWKDHIHSDDREWAAEYCMTSTREGRSHQFEYRMIAADGHIVWVRDIVTVVSINDKVVTLYGLIVDITEQKRSEDARLEAQQRYEELINNLHVGIYRRMADGRIVEANYAAVAMFETDSREELLKHNVMDFYQNKNRMKEITDKMLKYGFLKDEELEVQTAKGNKRLCSLSGIMKKDKQGNSYFDGIIEDITLRKKLEEQVRHSQKMEAIGELAAGIAHEINNPLASMAVCAESLIRRFQPDSFRGKEDYERFYSYLKIIEDEIFRSKNITIGLLDFSREKGLSLHDVNINRLLAEVIKLIQLQQKYSAFIVRINTADGLPNISADEGQLRQVFLAITKNAFEAMKPGGLLSISTASAMDEAKSVVKVIFKDNGCGISMENSSKIFEAFWTTKGHDGTGLGLSVCYGIVSQHGGKIEVESEEGLGSTFTVVLPITPPPPPKNINKIK